MPLIPESLKLTLNFPAKGSHTFDQTLLLFGRPSSVTGFLRTLRGIESEVEDTFTAILQYDGAQKDLLVTVKTNVVSPMKDQLKYFARGTKGSYVKVRCCLLSLLTSHLRHSNTLSPPKATSPEINNPPSTAPASKNPSASPRPPCRSQTRNSATNHNACTACSPPRASPSTNTTKSTNPMSTCGSATTRP
jgi:hypothetical protein